VACQEEEEGEAEEEDEEQAEFDGMLIESAGDVIPVMAKLVGGENFLTFFAGFLPDLLKRMVRNCLKVYGHFLLKSYLRSCVSLTIDILCSPDPVNV